MSARDLPTEHETNFVRSLVALLGGDNPATAKPDRAALAALRRGLGKTPGEVAEMFPYVIHWCGGMDERRQNDFFLVAALFATHQGPRPPHPASSDPRRNNLGASFRILSDRTESGSIEKRFVALLNASRPELDDHLRHAIKLMRANSVGVDWAQLLHDLAGWNWSSRAIQRRWASGYWFTEYTPSATADAKDTSAKA